MVDFKLICLFSQSLMLLYGLLMADVWLLEILDMDISFNSPGLQVYFLSYFFSLVLFLVWFDLILKDWILIQVWNTVFA
jgi:hypothetical protein